jgi:hypothetical protein
MEGIGDLDCEEAPVHEVRRSSAMMTLREAQQARTAQLLIRSLEAQAAEIERLPNPRKPRVGDEVWLSTNGIEMWMRNEFTPLFMGPYKVKRVHWATRRCSLDLPESSRITSAPFRFTQLRVHWLVPYLPTIFSRASSSADNDQAQNCELSMSCPHPHLDGSFLDSNEVMFEAADSLRKSPVGSIEVDMDVGGKGEAFDPSQDDDSQNDDCPAEEYDPPSHEVLFRTADKLRRCSISPTLRPAEDDAGFRPAHAARKLRGIKEFSVSELLALPRPTGKLFCEEEVPLMAGSRPGSLRGAEALLSSMSAKGW